MQPLWTHFFIMALIASAGYSISQMPPYLNASKEMKLAEGEYKSQNYSAAETHYEAAVALVPGASNARVGLIKALFSQNNRSKDEKAAKIIPGTTITKEEKVELINIAPKEYWELINYPYRSSATESDETNKSSDTSPDTTSEKK